MKKYTAPVAKTISLGSEHSIMLTGSLNSGVTAEGSEAMSNHRGASESIWGED